MEESLIQKLIVLENKDKLPKDYIPVNDELVKCFKSRYSSDKMTECQELENNEVRRIFNYYDPSNIIKIYHILKESSGFLEKKDIKYLFFEIKDTLYKNKIQVNEKSFVNKMLNFYNSSKDKVPFSDVKVFFYELLNNIKPKTVIFK